MACSSRITSLKLGRFEGSLSQHFRINFAKTSGVFLGIGGLRSLLSTSRLTCKPVRCLKGGSRDAISQRIIPQLKTSAFSLYFWLAMTSGAIHWQVPILPVMQLSRPFVHPKSANFTRPLSSKSKLRLLRSRCSTGGLQECRQWTPLAVSRAIRFRYYQLRGSSRFWMLDHKEPLEQYSRTMAKLGDLVHAPRNMTTLGCLSASIAAHQLKKSLTALSDYILNILMATVVSLQSPLQMIPQPPSEIWLSKMSSSKSISMLQLNTRG